VGVLGCKGLVVSQGVQKQRQKQEIGRYGCAFTPAFGRAEAPLARCFLARLKPCPSGSWLCLTGVHAFWQWKGFVSSLSFEAFDEISFNLGPVFLRDAEPDAVAGGAVGHDVVVAEGAFVVGA
jgi:hypothetical protein